MASLGFTSNLRRKPLPGTGDFTLGPRVQPQPVQPAAPVAPTTAPAPPARTLPINNTPPATTPGAPQEMTWQAQTNAPRGGQGGYGYTTQQNVTPSYMRTPPQGGQANQYSVSRPPPSGGGGQGYYQPDRNAAQTSYNPRNVPGLKWNGQSWQEVQSGADVTYDGQTGKYYYEGYEIPQNDLQSLYNYGPDGYQVGENYRGATQSRYNPNTVPGLKWNGQSWEEVQGGADVTYDGQSGKYFYKGYEIPQDQLANLYQNGPGDMDGGGEGRGYLSPDEIQGNLRNLGFGQMDRQFTAPQMGPLTMPTGGRIDMSQIGTVNAPPTIKAPTVTAEQGGFQDFEALEKSMYESEYRPVQRELNRQRTMADEQLAAQLAQAGIAESGTGVGQRAAQSDEYYRKEIAASEDAANRAATQRYGMEYTQSMRNAELRQEANLANANFNMQAQVENASNILTANIASSQQRTQAAIAQGQIDSAAGIAAAQMANQYQYQQASLYLQTMGLNVEQAQNARQNYLQLLGLQQQDLQHMDQQQLAVLTTMFNTYLKQVGILADAGKETSGKEDSKQSDLDIDYEGGS